MKELESRPNCEQPFPSGCFCKLPSSRNDVGEPLQRATEETEFKATCREKFSSFFLPHSPPAPPDGGRSDYSLSGRFGKKRNERRKEA